jgi:pimeloyl-ACP methyl ester carboxylesterase
VRARQPDYAGYAVNDGVRIYYEAHGQRPDTVLLMHPHPIMNSRLWKMQVPFLARHYKTVVYDGRGCARSDRPASRYSLDHLVGDAAAVLDDLQVSRCAIVATASGSRPAVALADRYPDRVAAMMLLAPRFSGAPSITPGEWSQWKARYVTEYDDAVRHLMSIKVFPEPHSTKLQDDFWGWAHETDPRIIIAATQECWAHADVRPLLSRVRCPVLLIHGRGDQDAPYEESLEGQRLLADSRLVTIETPGHFSAGRDPVRINLLLREFLNRDVPWMFPGRVA